MLKGLLAFTLILDLRRPGARKKTTCWPRARTSSRVRRAAYLSPAFIVAGKLLKKAIALQKRRRVYG